MYSIFEDQKLKISTLKPTNSLSDFESAAYLSDKI